MPYFLIDTKTFDEKKASGTVTRTFLKVYALRRDDLLWFHIENYWDGKQRAPITLTEVCLFTI